MTIKLETLPPDMRLQLLGVYMNVYIDAWPIKLNFETWWAELPGLDLDFVWWG